MNKQLAIIGIVVGLVIVYWIGVALLPDETKIRWRIEQAVEAFNAGRASACLEGFADDYRDETTRVDKQMLLRYLQSLFIRAQNRRDDRFRYPVYLPGEELEIRVNGEDGARAEADGKVLFHSYGEESSPPLWEVEVHAEFSRESGEWLVQRSSFKTLSGKPPF